MNRRRWFVETCLAVAVFGAAVWWGTAYWDASYRAGRPPFFYQDYFEPAVMMACGKGFVISHPQVPAVKAFLARVTDHLSCAEIPANTVLGTEGVYQGVWRYLMVATAICWRIRGIAWGVLGPLLGVLFGGTIAAGYGILRLGMGRLLALVCAFGLSVSTLHLLNLPHLRDYAKAPFTLALVLILGVLVKGRPTRLVLLGCAAAYGLVLGVGYGFRTDFLVNIPVFFLVLFAFVDGGVLKNLPMKLASAALCLAVFVIAALPIITVVYRSGGCQWHTALLGLTTQFTEVLGVEDAPYDFGHAYSDSAVYRIVSSYARRANPNAPPLAFCSHDYDVATGQYLLNIVRQFPADMLTRTYASVAAIAQLPFKAEWLNAPFPGLAPAVYSIRLVVLPKFSGTGPVWIAVAVVLMSLVSVRLAFFLAFFLLYFGGYPVIQFANRHYFHLEIITWWAFGFVVHQVGTVALARLRGTDLVRPNWRQAAWVLTAMLAIAVVPLVTLRLYQQSMLRGFFRQYVQAPVDEWPVEPAPPGQTLTVRSPLPPSGLVTAESFIVAALNAWKCGERPSVTLRYDKAFPGDDLTRTFTLERRSATPRPTYIFTPVYRHFVGVEFSDTRPGCFGGVSSVRDVSRMTLLLPAVLPPGWERERLFEQLKTAQLPFMAVSLPDPRVRSFPPEAIITSADTLRVPVPLVADDMTFRAAIASISGEGWTIAGKADGPFSYVLRSKPQRVDDARRLIARVRVRAGGATVGLLDHDRWAGFVNLASAGQFIVVVEPPGKGVYDVVVANAISDPSLATDIVVSSIGWDREPPIGPQQAARAPVTAAKPPDPRVRSFPPEAIITSADTLRVPVPLVADDMTFRAAIASISGEGWTIAGKADGPFSYVLRSKPQRVDDARRLVARVRVRAGGATVGLLHRDRWAAKVNLTSAGEFIVVIEPPGKGVYDVVVANALFDPSLATDIVVSSIGWDREPPSKPQQAARAPVTAVRPPEPRVRTFPPGATATSPETLGVPTPLTGDDMAFRAAIATIGREGWKIAGKADGPFSYVLRSKPQPVDDARRLVANVRVRAGGVTIGLLKNDQWAGLINLTSAGEFIVVIVPPGKGVYDVVVANALSSSSLATDVVVSSIGWVRR